MFQIARQQALMRWDSLPIILREALFSEYNANILWKICEGQHLSEDKISKVATLAGDVIMGFMHPEDLAKEIKEALGINIEIANSIFAEINRKIFMPLRGEIDKVYSSAGALTEEKLAEEIALAVSEAELPPVEISEEHIVDLRTLKREEAAVKENVKSEEKEILTPSAVNQAEPIIIHKEESARPILGAKRSLGGLFGFLRGEKEAEPKAVEAKIEIGRTAEEMSKEIPEPPKLKVVHYSEFKTPVADSLSKTDDKREELPVPVSPKPISSVLPKTALDILEIEPPVESPAQVAAKVFEKAPEKAPETPLLPPKPPIPPKPPVPPQEPKFEIKKGEEVIDLRTMQKISNIKNQNAK